MVCIAGKICKLEIRWDLRKFSVKTLTFARWPLKKNVVSLVIVLTARLVALEIARVHRSVLQILANFFNFWSCLIIVILMQTPGDSNTRWISFAVEDFPSFLRMRRTLLLLKNFRGGTANNNQKNLPWWLLRKCFHLTLVESLRGWFSDPFWES